jgi:hypothetical protein
MIERHPKVRRRWLAPMGTLLLIPVLTWPVAGAARPSCTIKPQSPTIEAGASVQWSASVNELRSSRLRYSWFLDGAFQSSSSQSSPDAVYDQAGSWTTTLRVSDGRRSARCQTSVTVTAVGTGGGGGGDGGGGVVAPDLSINSTSQDSLGFVPDAVPEQPIVVNSGYSVLAINDLGMHCGDLDTRVASILPPFQVLLAQVIRKGAEPELNPAGVDLYYSAASNPNDPILDRSELDGLKTDGSVYKTNFWDTVAKGTYDPFYPAFNPFDPSVTLTPLAGAPFNVGPDVGLPVPNVEELYIGHDGEVNSGDEGLSAVLHAMPGISEPYMANSP